MRAADLPPCAKHRERACPHCYTVAASADDVDALLQLREDAERAGAFPERSTEAVRAWLRLHPPGLVALQQDLARVLAGIQAAHVLPDRAALVQRIEELAARVDAQLAAAGGRS